MKPLRIAAIALFLPVLAFAKTQNGSRAAAPQVHGFRAEFLASVDEAEAKLMELVETTPAESFSWRPGSGVRSISEVYMHVAGGNYFLATFLGVPAPKPARDLEKSVTRKADVAAELKRSFDHLRAAAARTDNLEKPVKMFGKNTTRRGVLLTISNHLHEHLGQSVAYARMNGVTPPWSR